MSDPFGINTTPFFDTVTPVSATWLNAVSDLLSEQLSGALAGSNAGVLPFPDTDSFKVTSGAGLSINVAAGAGIGYHSTYGHVYLKSDTQSNIVPSGLVASDTVYVFASIADNTTALTGTPTFTTSATPSSNGGILLAKVVTGVASISSVIDLRVFDEDAYSADKFYLPRHKVSYNGQLWRAKQAVNNTTPTAGAFWEQLTTGSGSGGHIVKNEGSALTQRSGLNFIGNSVVVTDDSEGDENEIAINHKADAVHTVAQPVTLQVDELNDQTNPVISVTQGDNIQATLTTVDGVTFLHLAAITDATVWRSGVGPPPNVLGSANDFYIDTADLNLYQKVSGAYIFKANIKGAPGIQGAPGAAWLSGAGVPNNATGADGDRYHNETNGDVYLKAAGAWGSPYANIKGADGAGSGTVTSVGVSAPSILSVSNSPITTTGTIALALSNQTANFVFSGPASGSATTPAFRALVADDVPTLPASKLTSGTLDIARIPVAGQPEVLEYALSNETTAITAGTAKLTMRMPFAMTLTAVRSSLSTASSSGLVTIDVNEGGASILSTKLSIDATEKTSTTAATAAVISDTALADDAEITFDIDAAGTGAMGLKVKLIGVRA
jgi:hypothetical protein